MHTWSWKCREQPVSSECKLRWFAPTSMAFTWWMVLGCWRTSRLQCPKSLVDYLRSGFFWAGNLAGRFLWHTHRYVYLHIKLYCRTYDVCYIILCIYTIYIYIFMNARVCICLYIYIHTQVYTDMHAYNCFLMTIFCKYLRAYIYIHMQYIIYI